MEFFETPEQVAQQLEETRLRLEQFGDEASSDDILGRLATASPMHPTLLIRRLFMAMTVVTSLATATLIALPYFAEPGWVHGIRQLETAAFGGAPLPLVMIICALCMAIAWFTATQAALAFGRECALLPYEQRVRDQLMGEYTRLSGQKAVMERLAGTPMGAGIRSRTPGPAPRAATPPPLSRRTATPAPVARGASASLVRRAAGPLTSPSRSNSHIGTPTPAPMSRGASLGAAPASSAAPIGGRAAVHARLASAGSTHISGGPSSPGSRGSSFGQRSASASGRHWSQESSSGHYDEPAAGMGTASMRVPSPAEPTPSAPSTGLAVGLKRTSSKAVAPPLTADDEPLPMLGDDSMFDVADIVDNTPNQYFIEAEHSGSNGLRPPSNTRIPSWGMVTEPWLEDTIEKAEILARGFPVQARLEFSPEENLPFVLVLERATPAMAVRCMMSYVEFLASISTPPRGRVEFRSVATMDPAFYRNVMSALEPYFEDNCEVTRDTRRKRVEIDFLEPDVGWQDYPYLPIDG